jgi:iron(III) transport system permease protein
MQETSRRDFAGGTALPARARRERHPVAFVLALVIAAIVFVPVAVLAAIAITGTGADWPHLARNVLPGSARTTIWLLLLVAGGTASIGVTTAWLVVAYDFPLRRMLA